MKNWLDKMERRFGRYAIRNLTMYLLAGYAIGYLLSFTMPQLLTYFTLEPAQILKGQVWRLLSWVIIPPNDNIIFVIFMMLLYYSLGNTLESYWGAFRYNVYIFSGILFTVIGAFIVNGLIGGITGFGSLYSTYYINMSIFLACASIMPDYQLLLSALSRSRFRLQKKKIIKFKRDAMITIRMIRPPCTASTASRTTSRIASHFILIGIMP